MKCDPLTLAVPERGDRAASGSSTARHASASASIWPRRLGQPCIMNIWTGDGFKDVTRRTAWARATRYKESMDEILSEPL